MAVKINVRGVKIGEGIPKICVPLTGAILDEILSEARLAKQHGADLVEWRADCFARLTEEDMLPEVLVKLRTELEEIPLLFTIRTKREGGCVEIQPDAYTRINRIAVASGADLIDVELMAGHTLLREMVEYAHNNGVYVVASNHNFSCTPPQEELLCRLNQMHELGADLPKIAMMPMVFEDVISVLGATCEFVRQHPCCPVVGISMGGLGAVTRVAGQAAGSAITFGTVGKASAPGQIEIAALREILHTLEVPQSK